MLLGGLVVASRLWFDRVQKPRLAERIGIESLSARHWRDGLALTLAALAEEGWVADETEALRGGIPTGERVLHRNGKQRLLVYKHGTTYRIGPPTLLDAERQRQEAHADEVMVVTLGRIDSEALSQAERMRVLCLDGTAVWRRVGQRLDPATLTAINAEAEQGIERPRRLASLGAVVLGLAVVIGGGGLDERTSDDALTNATSEDGAAARTVARQQSAPLAASTDQAQPSSTPAEVAKGVAALPEVRSATWSSSSTLVMVVVASSNSDLAHAAVCARADRYPLLRDVRLQFEEDDGAKVHWRRCD